jgi:broad specificity phosphatase PhoE
LQRLAAISQRAGARQATEIHLAPSAIGRVNTESTAHRTLFSQCPSRCAAIDGPLAVAVVVERDLAEFNAGDLPGEEWNRSPIRGQFDRLLTHTTTRRPGGESADQLRQRPVLFPLA